MLFDFIVAKRQKGIQMLKFLTWAIASLAIMAAPVFAAEDALPGVFCRQADIIMRIPAALKTDAEYAAASQDAEPDEAINSLLDQAISEGGCDDNIAATDIVFNDSVKEVCDGAIGYCYLQGLATAKLPPEDGNVFAEGFAFRITHDYQTAAATVTPTSDVIKAVLIPKPKQCQTVLVQRTKTCIQTSGVGNNCSCPQ